PAVELASQLRHPTLYEFLRSAGVKLPRSEWLYGLTLPLGGAEVTMEDLVRLYAALANNGELRPLRRTSRDPTALRGRSIIMPEAAFLTLEMLNLPRPEVGRAYSDQAAPVFWKTGTSHGFRDAWSIAVFNHYVLAVWIGNFDGRGNGTFVGRIAAAPLLFQIIDSLRAMTERASSGAKSMNFGRRSCYRSFAVLECPENCRHLFCRKQTRSWSRALGILPGLSLQRPGARMKF